MQTKLKLAAYLREEAEWRDEKAEEYPDDARNRRSAQRLRSLAEHVEGLPDSDESLRALDAIQEPFANDRFVPSQWAGELISKFGFHSDEEPGSFLDRLVEVEAAEDADRGHGIYE